MAGRSVERVAPERATLHVEVGFDAGDRADASHRTTTLANRVVAHLQALEGAGVSPLTSYAVFPMTTHSWRPHSDAGAVLPPRHAASVSMEVTFQDFGALAEFGAQVGGLAGVQLRGVEWTLTAATRSRLEERVLTAAVADARGRAVSIARSLGAADVEPLEVADPGLLARAGVEQPGPRMQPMSLSAGAEAFRAGGQEAVQLVPQELTVEASVHARFTTV